MPDLPFRCRALRAVSSDGAHRHAHELGQLIFLRRGAMLCQSASLRWLLAAGQIGWIPAGVEHSAEQVSDLDGVAAYVDSGVFAQLPPHVLIAPASRLLGPLLERQLAYEAEPWEGRRRRLAEVIVDELLQLEGLPQQLPLPEEPRLRRLCLQALGALDKAWALDDLATAHGFSRATLTRAFARHTGLSFGRWLSQARMLAAAQALNAGREAGAVALEVGFQSFSAFCAAFRRHHGVSPGEFQRAQITA
ncbi:AraC family transcriptional regulator [Chromobacterium sp. IIBBL 290-4]|uniref:AraC family transcriptional regulator n=1 Tax=Chromobacterium sp. IIBBL 290-4 TaxID=2953890 RepID=UPI0020B74815|nr:AraC family transcriptional regulator [Chromobacterium sp. IIBBL 290-4]UTH72386.1 AraC family transcriptional regulator [Chromobacterium sp. IIBBL 290-4]